MNDLMLLLAAVALAAAGGDAFLKSILSAAWHLRVPTSVVATTLAAFATSSPEFTVSTVAALAGRPEIGLGDALGSNVANIAFIFGLALLFGAVRTSREAFEHDFYFALVVPALTFVFLLDGRIARGEASALLAIFALWLAWTVRNALRLRQTHPDGQTKAPSVPMTIAQGVLGLGALVAAGRLFVTGASGIATAWNLEPFVIGAVLVAVGTSMPELVTVVLSRLRGHDEVGIGTLIGSNLFNGLAIVGVAGSIHPIAAPLAEVTLTLVCGVLALLLLLPNRSGLIVRRRGLTLLLLYVAFVWAAVVA